MLVYQGGKARPYLLRAYLPGGEPGGTPGKPRDTLRPKKRPSRRRPKPKGKPRRGEVGKPGTETKSPKAIRVPRGTVGKGLVSDRIKNMGYVS